MGSRWRALDRIESLSQRIALARLLEAGGPPIERIVERCGYSDVASFRKLFTREVGMSPREYGSRFGRHSQSH